MYRSDFQECLELAGTQEKLTIQIAMLSRFLSISQRQKTISVAHFTLIVMNEMKIEETFSVLFSLVEEEYF